MESRQELREMGVKTHTPEFKRWFGNSKIVDEQGRPLMVYHSSKNQTELEEDGEFQTYGDETLGDNSQSQGGYFARDIDDAKKYGDKNPQVYYLSIKNPWMGDIADFYKKEYPTAVEKLKNKLIEKYGEKEGIESLSKAADIIESYVDDLETTHLETVLEELFGEINADNGVASRAITYIDGMWTVSPGWRKFDLENSGYDGQDDNWQIIAFSPTQIKSVDNRGTFDPNNPNFLF